MPQLAFVMSVVGLYSVLAHAVSQRTAEIGIRTALGAQSAWVIRLTMRGGLELVTVGLALGLAAAAGAARVMIGDRFHGTCPNQSSRKLHRLPPWPAA